MIMIVMMMIVMLAVMVMAVDIVIRMIIYDGRMQIRIHRGVSRSPISPIGAVSSLIGGSHHVGYDDEGSRYNNDDNHNGQNKIPPHTISIFYLEFVHKINLFFRKKIRQPVVVTSCRCIRIKLFKPDR